MISKPATVSSKISIVVFPATIVGAASSTLSTIMLIGDSASLPAGSVATTLIEYCWSVS